MNVLICGGGIAGLTAALCLHRVGFHCQVFEAKDDRDTTSAAIILAPSGVRVLCDLGLGDALLERGCPVSSARLMDHNGRLLADLPLHNKRWYGHDSVAMTRRVLHHLLTARCREAAIPVHYGAKLLDVVAIDEHSVTADFARLGRVTGQVLIGADGIHSATRRVVLARRSAPPAQRKDRHYYGFGMLAPISCLSADEAARLHLTAADTAMNMLRGPVGFVGFIGIGTPDQQQPQFMMWSHIAAAHVDADFDPKDRAQVRRALDRLRGHWCQPVGKMLSLVDQARPDIEVGCMAITALHPIATWSCPRVVLIGDAAHGYGPGAQGAALAMEDAMLLSKMMAGLPTHQASSQALAQCFAQFEKKRRPRVERIGNAAEARNDSRLEPSGRLAATIERCITQLMGWWYKNGYYNPEYTYTCDDDLVDQHRSKSWLLLAVLGVVIAFIYLIF